MNDSITPAELKALLEDGARIRVFDVRLEKDREPVTYPIPTVEWRDPGSVAQWAPLIGDTDEVIVHCVHGHHVSQSTRDALRERGIPARILEGGIGAWTEHAKEHESC